MRRIWHVQREMALLHLRRFRATLCMRVPVVSNSDLRMVRARKGRVPSDDTRVDIALQGHLFFLLVTNPTRLQLQSTARCATHREPLEPLLLLHTFSRVLMYVILPDETIDRHNVRQLETFKKEGSLHHFRRARVTEISSNRQNDKVGWSIVGTVLANAAVSLLRGSRSLSRACRLLS